MVKHIVMMEFKDKTKIEYIKDLLLDMKIDVLKNIEVGLNFTNSNRAMDLVLVTEFNSKEDLEIYRTHPNHLKVLEEIKKMIDYTKVVDYEL